jgi:hypothetical protein
MANPAVCAVCTVVIFFCDLTRSVPVFARKGVCGKKNNILYLCTVIRYERTTKK